MHRFHDLFKQLGLPYSDHSIAEFIASHRLGDKTLLPHAHFWSAAQSNFLRESIEQDADWAELVDQLNEALRNGL